MISKISHPHPEVAEAPQDSGGGAAAASQPPRAISASGSEPLARIREGLVHECLAADDRAIGEVPDTAHEHASEFHVGQDGFVVVGIEHFGGVFGHQAA